MSCAGNTIARSLALVAIGTIVAFADWGIRPLKLTLGGSGAGDDGAQKSQIAPPDDAPDDTGAGAGQADTPPSIGDGPDTPDGADPQAVTPAPFDAAALGVEIGTADAYQLWASGEVVFVDARPQKDYLAGHIPYAYLVPAETIDQGRLGDMMEIGGVDPSVRVVVYCEGGACDASHLVALTLQDMGFDKIHIDIDGFPAWQAAGYEVQTGSDTVLGDVP